MFVDFVCYPYIIQEILSQRAYNKETNSQTLQCIKPVSHKIISPQTNNILIIQEHLPQQIKMIHSKSRANQEFI